MAEESYGLRFARALQSNGGGFYPWGYGAIQELRAADRESMIQLVEREGGAVGYAVIQSIRTLEPEEFAARVAANYRRHGNLQAAFAQVHFSAEAEARSQEEGTYGQQFLDAIQAGGGSLSSFSFSVIQELKEADREGLIRVLRRVPPGLTYLEIQEVRNLGAKELADRVLARAHAASQLRLVMFAALAGGF